MQALLVLGLDPGDHLDVLLEPRAAELGRQQLVDLEDPGAVGHRDLDPHGAVAAGRDLDLLDRVGRQRVDVLVAGLERDPRAPAGHVERVGDAHDPGLDRERRAVAPVADDRVQRLGDDDRALGLLVGAGQQRAELVGGQEQAVSARGRRGGSTCRRSGTGSRRRSRPRRRARSSRSRRRRSGTTPRRNSSRASRSADVEHDLDVDPASGRDIPSRRVALTADTCHHALTCSSALTASSSRSSRRLPRVGARTRTSASASRGRRSAARHRRRVGSSRHRPRLQQHALADRRRARSAARRRTARTPPGGSAARPAAAAPARRRARTGARSRPRGSARQQPQRARERVGVEQRPGEPAQRRRAAADRHRLGRARAPRARRARRRPRARACGELGRRRRIERRQRVGEIARPERERRRTSVTCVGRGADDQLRGAAADVDHAELARRARGRASAATPTKASRASSSPERISTCQPACARGSPSTSAGAVGGAPDRRGGHRRGRRAAPSSRAQRELRGDHLDHLGDLARRRSSPSLADARADPGERALLVDLDAAVARRSRRRAAASCSSRCRCRRGARHAPRERYAPGGQQPGG